MLKKRLIPKLLLTKKKIGNDEIDILVTTRNYNSRTSIGDPLSQAKIYEANLADELIILGIDSIPLDENAELIHLIKRMSEQIFMPLCVGGGVSNLSHFENLLNAGADKISINSVLIERPEFAKEAAKNFGSQCVMASVDYKLVDKIPFIYDHKRKQLTDIELFNYAPMLVDIGVGEMHICNVDNDGTSIGIDIITGSIMNNELNIPLILSGGIGTAQDFVECFVQTNCSAIGAGTYFSSQDQNPMQARSHICNAKIPIRMGRKFSN